MTNNIIQTAAAVYIDTNSLMQSTNIINFLQQHEGNVQIIIPSCVRDQLVKLSGEDSPRGKQARDALEIIDDLYKSCFCLEYTDEPKPARFFIAKAEERRFGQLILVLTQSADLAHSLDIRRVSGCKVIMKRITMNGYLGNFDFSKLPPKFTALSDRCNASAVLKNLNLI